MSPVIGLALFMLRQSWHAHQTFGAPTALSALTAIMQAKAAHICLCLQLQ